MKLLSIAPLLAATLFFQPTLRASDQPETGTVKVLTDIPYKSGPELTDQEKERCKLDLYLPAEGKQFPSIVWFHGGSLTGGDKHGDNAIARSFAKGGVAFVSADYRLSPKTKFPGYIDDAAAAFAWVYHHISEYGGDPGKVFIGGHSAGGYLTYMVGLDPKYLQAYKLDLSAIAGLAPVSGQTMTHYTVREERGIGRYTIIADEAAPVFYVRKDTPPMLVLYADHDMPARAEENAYLVAIMKGAGNLRVTGQLVHDRDHGSIAGRMVNEDDPAREAILAFMKGEGKAAAK